MRPLRLTMSAFGPYKDKEIIDFTELQGHRLFVVSGNTGAGKTSIFDAICFALYGVASGEDRDDNRMLRSHFAADEVYTSVDFVFELKGRNYRVFRQLPHVRSGNKGATGEKYELYSVGVTDGLETPLTDRFIVSQIDQKIQELVGLTKDQFSQIVMLPQGEFRKLLTSDTENKEEILRRIFKTGMYKFVADHLNEKRKRAQRICEELAGVREYHINHVRGSLAGRADSELSNVFRQQQFNSYQVLEALDLEINYFTAQIQLHKELLHTQTAQYQANTEFYHVASGVNEQFDLIDLKTAAQQQLIDQEPVYLRQKQQLVLAEQAVHLVIYERQHTEMQAELRRRKKLLEEALSECLSAEEKLRVVKQQYEHEEVRAELREQCVREIDRLQGLLPIVRDIAGRQQKMLALESEVTVLEQQLLTVGQELTTKLNERSAYTAQVKELEAKVAVLSDCMEKLTLLREQAAFVREYLILMEKSLLEQEEVKQHYSHFEQSDKSYAMLEASWIEGQAGILASHLHVGDACPVCGGVEHPRKASLTANVPNKEELDHNRQVKALLEQKYLEARATLTATEQQLKEKQPRLLEYGFRVESVQDEYEQLVVSGKALAVEVKRLRDDQAKLEQCKQALESVDNRLEEIRKLKEDSISSLNEKKTIHAADKALFDQAWTAIPEDVRSLENLEQRLRTTEERKKQMDIEWKKAQKLYQETSERYVKSVSGRDHATSQEQDAQANQEKARVSFLDAMQQAGFATEEEYTAAKMSESDRALLKNRIEEYSTTLSTLRKQLAELSATLKGKERHDLALLKQQLQEREQHIEAIRAQYIQAQNDYTKGIESRNNIIQAEENWKAAEREFQLVKDLYDVVRGDNSK
ncbi:MAG: hypothetical protein K0R67_1793, partial [Paenibacillus sp.]|nr:hypothetical protein [Paenibacillus sp.]